MADDDTYTAEDEAYTVDDPTLTDRPKIVCAISEFRDQQPMTTTLTSAEFEVLDELTEDLLVAAARKSLNVPPLSLCPDEEQSNSISRDGDSITSSEMPVPWIIIPSVMDKLREFDEVSSEIRNADTKYGKHLPPLPLCLASAPDETQQQVCESSEIETSAPTVKSAEIEQLDSQVTPIRMQLLDALLVDEEFVADEAAAECTSIVAKSDGAGLETPIITEQLDAHVTPVRVQSSDALADEDDFVADEAATEFTSIVAVAVANSEGDVLEPETTTVDVKSATAEKPPQGRRRSFLSAVGRRLLKFGRRLCCCCK